MTTVGKRLSLPRQVSERHLAIFVAFRKSYSLLAGDFCKLPLRKNYQKTWPVVLPKPSKPLPMFYTHWMQWFEALKAQRLTSFNRCNFLQTTPQAFCKLLRLQSDSTYKLVPVKDNFVIKISIKTSQNISWLSISLRSSRACDLASEFRLELGDGWE